MQILEALDLYVAQLQADGRSPHTVAQCQRHIRLLARFIGERDLGQIQPQDLARFMISGLAMKTPTGTIKKPTSSNGLRSSLRTFFGFVHASGLVASNPARLVRRARIGSTPPRGLTPGERERLLAMLATGKTEAQLRDRGLFTFLISSGVRIGSALALDVEDLDLPAGEARLRTVKGGGSYTAYFPGHVSSLLRELIRSRPAGPVFCGVGGERLGVRQARRRLLLAATRAGLRPLSPHQLRHSYAIDLYERCGDVLLVQAALGHRSIMSTTVYARASAGRVRAAFTH